MMLITKVAFATMSTLVLLVTNARGEAKYQEEGGVVDAFEVFRNFPYVVAIYDVDHDGDLDCLTAVRTDFSDEPPSATYVFLLKGLGGHELRNITYHIKHGAAPDLTRYTLDDDYNFVEEGHFVYTDYKTCVVMEMPFEGRQECLLWTTRDTLDDVPEDCMDHYKDTCDDAVKAYDEESCAAFVQ